MLGFWKVRQKISLIDYRSWSQIIAILKQLEGYIGEARGRPAKYALPVKQPKPPQSKPKSRPIIDPDTLLPRPKTPPKKPQKQLEPPPRQKLILPAKPRDQEAINAAGSILEDWLASINIKQKQQEQDAVVKLNLGRTEAAVRTLLSLL